MLASVSGIFRLSKEPEIRYSTSGSEVCRLSLVNSSKYKKQDGSIKEDTCFIDAVCFAGAARNVHQYCKKGDRLFIQGLLKQDTWTTNEGKNMSKHSINIESIEFVEKKSDDALKPKAEPKVMEQIQIEDDGTIPF